MILYNQTIKAARGEQTGSKGGSKMKIWKREGYTVIEKPFDFDLHCFHIVRGDDETIGVIYPNTIDEMHSIIEDLENGESIEGWEDGMGNTIHLE